MNPSLRTVEFSRIATLWRCPSSNQIKSRWRLLGEAWQGDFMALPLSIGLALPDCVGMSGRNRFENLINQ
jgi:hypothetical protein